jgi:hypothetical protein
MPRGRVVERWALGGELMVGGAGDVRIKTLLITAP